MPNETISQIQLPNGNIYDIVGKAATIDSTYNSTTKTVTLSVGTLEDADNMAY